MDIPSLFMIPSAVSSGKVHSVFPNSTDADFDFNRDSSATRVNSQGLIEEVGFFGSELVSGDNANFNSSTGNWQQFRGVLSWDSYLQAGKWTDNNTSGGPVGFTMSGGVIPTLASKTYIIEFKAKTDSNNSFNFSFIGESSTFNAISNPNLTSDFQDYKFTFVTSTANQRLYVGFSGSPLDNGESYFIDNVSVKELIGDRARLNYEIEGGLVNTKPSLLLEPQSTNLITYSEDFSQWINQNSIDIANQITSPDGNNKGTKVESTSTSSNYIYRQITLATSTAYSISVFVKKGTSNIARLDIFDTVGGTEASVRINLDTEATSFINGTASFEKFPNDWYKLKVSFTSSSSLGTSFFRVFQESNVSGQYIYVFGAQLEQQSYCTSYIPTNGSTQTRSGETCNGAGTSSIFNDSEGVLYAELNFVNDTTSKLISINDNSASNRILFGNFSDGNFKVFSQSSDLIVVSALSGYNKIAAKYKSGDFSLFVNGTEVGTSTSTILPTGLSQLSFDNGAGGSVFYGKIRDIRVYNTKEMTDSEVDILLTKITS